MRLRSFTASRRRDAAWQQCRLSEADGGSSGGGGTSLRRRLGGTSASLVDASHRCLWQGAGGSAGRVGGHGHWAGWVVLACTAALHLHCHSIGRSRW
jgi:hypothetical protein